MVTRSRGDEPVSPALQHDPAAPGPRRPHTAAGVSRVAGRVVHIPNVTGRVPGLLKHVDQPARQALRVADWHSVHLQTMTGSHGGPLRRPEESLGRREFCKVPLYSCSQRNRAAQDAPRAAEAAAWGHAELVYQYKTWLREAPPLGDHRPFPAGTRFTTASRAWTWRPWPRTVPPGAPGFSTAA